jgi:hypothetical protein
MRELKEWREEVLLFFREAKIKEAVEVLAEATGIVESRRVEEKYKENERV